MTELSTDELSVLMIAAQGQPMMPIGRWKEPTEHLIELGLLKPQPCAQDPAGLHNCVITAAGKRACQANEQKDEDACRALVEKVKHAQEINRHSAFSDWPDICPKCGGTMDSPKWKFCPGCGADLRG